MTTSELLQGIAAIGIGAGLWQSVQMIRHPQRSIGTGNPPATDPRTVRQFGVAGAVMFGLTFLFILIKFVSE